MPKTGSWEPILFDITTIEKDLQVSAYFWHFSYHGKVVFQEQITWKLDDTLTPKNIWDMVMP